MVLWGLVLIYLVSALQGRAAPQERQRIFKKTSKILPDEADDRIYPNLGVVFKEIAKLQPTREIYTIHLTTQFPDVFQLYQEVVEPLTELLNFRCTKLLEEFCATTEKRLQSLKDYQARIKTDFRAKIDILQDDLPVLREAESNSRWGRKKRSANSKKAFAMGLIPFIGPAVVGAWAHERIDELEWRVEGLAMATGELFVAANRLAVNQQKLGRGLSTLTNITMQEFEKVHTYMGALKRDVVNLGKYFKWNMHQMAVSLKGYAEATNYMEQLDSSLQEYYIRFGRILQQMISIFHELNLGRLPRALVTHAQLQVVLENARDAIRDKYPGYDLVYTDASDYFNVPNIAASIIDYTLIVQIPAYVKLKSQALFNLYRVHSVHVPYSVRVANGLPETTKSYSYTKAELGATHFAASADDYMTLAMELLLDCEKRGGVYICPQVFVHTHRRRVTCLSAIYWGHPFDEIQQKCKYQYFHDVTPEAQIYSNRSFHLLANVGVPWNLICNNKAIPNRESGERYVLIKRSSLCRCALTTDLHYLPATITDCEGPPEAISLAYPFNAVVQFHYQQTAAKMFDYMEVYNAVNESEVPSLKLEVAESEDQVLSDEARDLPVAMDRVFKMIDSDKEAFLTQASFLKSRQNVKTWFSGKTVIFGVVLIMSVVGVIALLIVLCQFYQTGKVKALMTSAVVGGVASAVLPKARAASDSDSDISPAEWAAQMALERMYVIVVGFSSVLLYYLARKIFTKCILYRHVLPAQNSEESVHESQVFLEVASAKEVVRIYLTTVRAAAVQVLVPTPISPIITNVKKHLWYTNLTMDWGGQHFYIYDFEHPMQFPVIVSVPIYRRWLVERIMKETYAVRLLVLQDVYYALDSLRGADPGGVVWDASSQGSNSEQISTQLQSALEARQSQ